MKQLALLRHAKSSWDAPALSDFDRPLNARGRAAAERMGEEMRRRALRFDVVLASPACRVEQTLALVEQGYGEPLPVRWEQAIYEAPPNRLLDLLRRSDDALGNLLLVGHNPGLQMLAVQLADDRSNDAARSMAERFPTAALALFAVAIPRWADLAPGTAKLLNYLEPKELNPRP